MMSFIRKFINLRRTINKIPGPRDLPILGNLHNLELKNFSKFHQQSLDFSRQYKHSPVYRLWIGSLPVVFCHSPEAVQSVLTSSVHINKGYEYQFSKPWIGESVVFTKGPVWKEQRKTLTPIFRLNVVKEFIPCFNQQSRILVDVLSQEANTGEAFDILPKINLATLDIICQTVLGKAVHFQTNQNCEYVDAIARLKDDSMHRVLRPWLFPEGVYRRTSRGKENTLSLGIVHDFRSKIISERKLEHARKQLKNEGDPEHRNSLPLSLLDLLIEKQSTSESQISDSNIEDHIDTFLFAGHDTVAMAITWALYLLGRHPDVQEKVFQEIKEVLSDDLFRDIQLSDIDAMSYLDNVIKESMRLFPPVPKITRIAECDVTIAGYTVPKGTQISIDISGLHHNETIYPEPEEFRPERFEPNPNSVSRPRFSFIPYSAGPRNCIGLKFGGMEQKIVLASIVRSFEMESVQDENQVEPTVGITLRPANGIWVKLFKRGHHK